MTEGLEKNRIVRIKELESQIEDIKNRFPAHSLKPDLFRQLEKLEEELELLLKSIEV